MTQVNINAILIFSEVQTLDEDEQDQVMNLIRTIKRSHKAETVSDFVAAAARVNISKEDLELMRIAIEEERERSAREDGFPDVQFDE